MEERLGHLFASYAGHQPTYIKELAASGSNRRYYRIGDGNLSVVGAVGTDLRENKAFIGLDRHFVSKGLNVPRIYGISEDSMCYIQQDLGDTSLYDAVSHGRQCGIYSEEEKSLLKFVISKLPDIQFAGAQDLDFSLCYPEREFGRRSIMADLNYFKYCFLKAVVPDFDEVMLENDFRALCDDILAFPYDAFMYRDFQSRNVMIDNWKPYFIDFQGGRRGPAHYDVASFIYQARSCYPSQLKEELIEEYIEAAKHFIDLDAARFKEELRLFVLLRTLQVLGAYGFRGYFERKPHFLESIPYAMLNVAELTAKPLNSYPYLMSLLTTIASMPRFALAGVENIAKSEQCRSVSAAGVDVVVKEGGSEMESTAVKDGGAERDGTVVKEGVTEREGTAAKKEDDAKDSEGKKERLLITVFSFSYRKGFPQDGSGNGGGYVFDCRSIHNPGRYPRYASLTGMDSEVIKFLEDDGEVLSFMDNVYGLVDRHVERFLSRGFTRMMVCFGCTGGRHRSVYCAESLAGHLAQKYDVDVRLVHREQNISRDLHGSASISGATGNLNCRAAKPMTDKTLEE